MLARGQSFILCLLLFSGLQTARLGIGSTPRLRTLSHVTSRSHCLSLSTCRIKTPWLATACNFWTCHCSQSLMFVLIPTWSCWSHGAHGAVGWRSGFGGQLRHFVSWLQSIFGGWQHSGFQCSFPSIVSGISLAISQFYSGSVGQDL